MLLEAAFQVANAIRNANVAQKRRQVNANGLFVRRELLCVLTQLARRQINILTREQIPLNNFHHSIWRRSSEPDLCDIAGKLMCVLRKRERKLRAGSFNKRRRFRSSLRPLPQ